MIRVGNRIASGKNQLLMIYLTEKDKKNIADMHPDCNVYCQIPDDIPEKYIKRIQTIIEMFKEDCEDELAKPTKDSSNTNE